MNFATLKGLTIPEGVVTQITDASGRVLWSALKEIVTGTLILRPSADISVEHILYPADSAAAYLLINEEVSDEKTTYIRSPEPLINDADGEETSTSKFELSNTTHLDVNRFIITSVSIEGDPYSSSTGSPAKNRFALEINGIMTESVYVESEKNVDISTSMNSAIALINDFIFEHGTLPNINIIIESIGYKEIGESKTTYVKTGVSQVYVVLGYEGY